MSDNPRVIAPVKAFADETLKVINDIFGHWEQALADSKHGIFYNMPIEGIKGTGGIQISANAASENLENLYIDMAPEGPYLLLNTDFEGSAVITPTVPTTPVAPVIQNQPAAPVQTPPVAPVSITTHKLFSNLMSSNTPEATTSTLIKGIEAKMINLKGITDGILYNQGLKEIFASLKKLVSAKTQKDVSRLINSIITSLDVEAVNYAADDESPLPVTEFIRDAMGMDKFYNVIFKSTADPSNFNLSAIRDILMEEIKNMPDMSLMLDYADIIDQITQTNCK
ncbi:MAG: hypothetical protein ACOH2V_01180 [Candidatus Saccharimonadaceae bacterium]